MKKLLPSLLIVAFLSINVACKGDKENQAGDAAAAAGDAAEKAGDAAKAAGDAAKEATK